MSDEQPLDEWFASIHRQSEATIALVLDALRRDGQSVADYVVVVADVTNEATLFFVNQLGDVPLDPAKPGFVGAIPKETVGRALRLMDADAFATDVEQPLDRGLMRLLIAARGQIRCADVTALPVMVRGGTA